MIENILSIHDLSLYQFHHLLDLARQIKEKPSRYHQTLKAKFIALIFQKPSLRTRAAFEIGIRQLGGEALNINPIDINLNGREDLNEVCKNLERWVDAIVIRARNHTLLEKITAESKLSIVNARSDIFHPCQALADIFTLKERRKDLASLKMTFIGHGSPTCHSLMLAAAKTGISLSIATPADKGPLDEVIALAERDAQESEFTFQVNQDPAQAILDADVVYVDSWNAPSFQIDSSLMALAKKSALILHCQPLQAEEGISKEVLRSSMSIIYEQAENMLHIQKAIMVSLFGKNR